MLARRRSRIILASSDGALDPPTQPRCPAVAAHVQPCKATCGSKGREPKTRRSRDGGSAATAQQGRLRLLQKVNLDHADAGCLRLVSHLHGVLPGRDRGNNSCFPIIGRLETSSFKFLFLRQIALPVVILAHDRSILVSELKRRVL